MLEVTEKPEIEFPVARKGIHTGDIVLFWAFNKGVVISSGSSDGDEVGFTSGTWTPCNDTDFWEPVDLKITG